MKYLTAEETKIVRCILRSIVPKARVEIFGSRATGIRRKKFSDLDLLIDAKRPLSFTRYGKLRESFSDSNLPFRVDIVDAKSTSKKFLDQIRTKTIIIQK